MSDVISDRGQRGCWELTRGCGSAEGGINAALFAACDLITQAGQGPLVRKTMGASLQGGDGPGGPAGGSGGQPGALGVLQVRNGLRIFVPSRFLLIQLSVDQMRRSEHSGSILKLNKKINTLKKVSELQQELLSENVLQNLLQNPQQNLLQYLIKPADTTFRLHRAFPCDVPVMTSRSRTPWFSVPHSPFMSMGFLWVA